MLCRVVVDPAKADVTPVNAQKFDKLQELANQPGWTQLILVDACIAMHATRGGARRRKRATSHELCCTGFHSSRRCAGSLLDSSDPVARCGGAFRGGYPPKADSRPTRQSC